MKNEEIEHIIKQTLYETSRKYSKRDAAVVLFYALRDKEKDYFEQININSEPINKMSYKEFQDGIMRIYVQIICDEELQNRMEELIKYEESYDRALNKICNYVTSISVYEGEIQEEQAKTKNSSTYSESITGLTDSVEGDIEIDETCSATTSIGKVRENQEDAVLLVKDNNNSDFKMMAVADGMGGESNGELASAVLIEKLRQWFEELDEETKKQGFIDINSLIETLDARIKQTSLLINNSFLMGGSTLVCAIVGKKQTLVVNVGDSRAYIMKNGSLRQVSTDDSIVQEKFEKGEIPSREAMRFDWEASGITQAICEKDITPHYVVIDNDDYDMLLLFSDGVTDCLTEDEIAVVCRQTDKKLVAKKVVERALTKDSSAYDYLTDDDLEGYWQFNEKIKAGKDNSTAVRFTPNKQDEEER